jgi:KAP-like P-loop domain-containing protein
MHVDGPWGSGKSTLIGFVRAELAQQKWVTVEFDAWRQAGVDPPWWALLVALRGGVCRDRGLLGHVWWRGAEVLVRMRKTGGAFVLAVALLLTVSAAVFLAAETGAGGRQVAR